MAFEARFIWPFLFLRIGLRVQKIRLVWVRVPAEPMRVEYEFLYTFNGAVASGRRYPVCDGPIRNGRDAL